MSPSADPEPQTRRVVRLTNWNVVEDTSGRIHLYQNRYSHLCYKLEGLVLLIMASFCLTVGHGILTQAPWMGVQHPNARITGAACLIVGYFLGLPALRRLTGTRWLVVDCTGVTVGRSCLGFRETQLHPGKPRVSLIKTRHPRGQLSYSLTISSAASCPAFSTLVRDWMLDLLWGRLSRHNFSLSGSREELTAIRKELTRSTQGAMGVHGPSHPKKRRKGTGSAFRRG